MVPQQPESTVRAMVNDRGCARQIAQQRFLTNELLPSRTTNCQSARRPSARYARLQGCTSPLEKRLLLYLEVCS